MKARVKTYEVNRDRAVKLAANHNCVNMEVAERYTDSDPLRCPALQSW